VIEHGLGACDENGLPSEVLERLLVVAGGSSRDLTTPPYLINDPCIG
jgi:hypothetical protein